MKIVITHPNSKSIASNDEQIVPISELSAILPSSCESIHLGDSMDFIPYHQREKLIFMAAKRLKYGGILTLSGSDAKSLASQMYHNNISTKHINTSLYDGRLSIDHITNVVRQLEKMDLTIVDEKLDNLYFSIKATRKNSNE